MKILKHIPECEQILTPEALEFLTKLTEGYGQKIKNLLNLRKTGSKTTFLSATQSIREDDWTAAAIPEDILDRRVEITGPVDRKMIINAMNSGANVFMADFEDSNSPTWENCILGQVNLRDAAVKTIEYHDNIKNKHYKLNSETATLFVRPRGLHLTEKHLTHNGEAIPASLFDFGLYFFHNAASLIEQGTRPYFYLPKLEHFHEAQLWADIFAFSERELGIEHGTIRATVLIETLPAAFQMDEIIYALREYSAGLNCGRWDYIFSYIKTLHGDSACLVPDRDQVTMTQTFMRTYSDLLVHTCHRRGVHAMGGMAAQIPIKNDSESNERALNKVREDKLREVQNGHDGTWVAHPGLVQIAKEIFDEHMPTPNQISRQTENTAFEEDLVKPPKGTFTEFGLRKNIEVSLRYLNSWLAGNGCVPINNLMEDAATAEISRAQIWQWLKYDVVLDTYQVVTPDYFNEVLDEVSEEVSSTEEATGLLRNFCLNETLDDFLTIKAYELL